MAEWRSSSVSPGVRCRSDGGQLLVPAVQLHNDLEHRAHVLVEILLYALYQIRRFIIVLVTFHKSSFPLIFLNLISSLSALKPLMSKIFKLTLCIIYCKLSGAQRGYRAYRGYFL